MTDATAIAAFTAAGLGVVNIGFSARLIRGQSRQEWKRAELMGPIRRFAATAESVDEWLTVLGVVAGLGTPPEPERLAFATQQIRELDREASELELLSPALGVHARAFAREARASQAELQGDSGIAGTMRRPHTDIAQFDKRPMAALRDEFMRQARRQLDAGK
jgi:hypothetical protein